MESGKTVLITGASSGFGYLAALKFARGGYFTLATVRNPGSAGVLELQTIQKREQLPLEVLRLDVAESRSVDQCLSLVRRKSDHLDILVNNAGFGYLGPVEDFTIEEVRAQYETNVFGVLRLVKAVVPLMRERGSGLIINLSSINGLIPFPLFGVYSSSKFALESLSEALRFELSPFGIKVVLVEPGSFLTQFASNRKHPLNFGRENSPYRELVKSFFRRYEKAHDRAREGFLRKLTDPQKVVDLIYAVAEVKNPRARYLVGWDAHFYFWLRRLLPGFLWDWVLHRAYDWPSRDRSANSPRP